MVGQSLRLPCGICPIQVPRQAAVHLGWCTGPHRAVSAGGRARGAMAAKTVGRRSWPWASRVGSGPGSRPRVYRTGWEGGVRYEELRAWRGGGNSRKATLSGKYSFAPRTPAAVASTSSAQASALCEPARAEFCINSRQVRAELALMGTMHMGQAPARGQRTVPSRMALFLALALALPARRVESSRKGGGCGCGDGAGVAAMMARAEHHAASGDHNCARECMERAVAVDLERGATDAAGSGGAIQRLDALHRLARALYGRRELYAAASVLQLAAQIRKSTLTMTFA